MNEISTVQLNTTKSLKKIEKIRESRLRENEYVLKQQSYRRQCYVYLQTLNFFVQNQWALSAYARVPAKNGRSDCKILNTTLFKYFTGNPIKITPENTYKRWNRTIGDSYPNVSL